jgi:uncharacterized protein YjbJ (UPF0337 family)
MNNFKNVLEGNWEEVKGDIQANWGKLTDSDIDKINGSYKSLVGKLRKSYGYKSEEVEQQISDFFESGDFDTLILKSKNKIEEIKNIVFETIDDYFQTAKQKTIDTEKAIVKYATDNPLKVIGLVASVSLIAGCLLRYKRS